MKVSTFWFLLAAFDLVITILGHGNTDVSVAFWACLILSAVTHKDERS